MKNKETANHVKSFLSNYGISVVILALGCVLTILSPHFLQTGNIINILMQVSITTVIGVGMTFVILTGGIDLAVGPQVAFCGAVMALCLMECKERGVPESVSILFAILMGLLTGLMFGLVNGLIITKGKVPAFIMTLGMQSIARGGVYALCNGDYVRVSSKTFTFLGGGRIGNVIPMSIVVSTLIVFIAAWILSNTKFGRYVYALGGNREALRLSGINADRVEIKVYVISAFMCVIAAVLLLGKLQMASPTHGDGYETDAIAACIVGGTRITGGEGRVFGTFLGAILIGMLRNGLNLMNVNSDIQKIVIGSVIIGAVLFNKIREKN